MINIFKGKGPLSQEDLKHIQEMNGHNWITELYLGEEGEVDPGIERIVNGLLQNMGRLTDRLLLTISKFNNMEDHAGDCAIHLDSSKAHPIDGICNCGYGLQKAREGDRSQMYSPQKITR